MPGPMDTNYGTVDQVAYARAMAKYLREKKGFQMTPGMAVLPGSWMNGLGDIVDAVSQGRYQDIAGQQDRTLTERKLDPNYVGPSAPSTVGSSLSQTLHNLYKKATGANKVIPPGTEPKEITTGSINPQEKIGQEGETVDTKSLNEYADAVKMRENPKLFRGDVDRSKAEWDFKQHTNGFGTKARAEDETIDTAESHRRFDEDWAKAQKVVDEFKPGLPVGPKAALTSLTFNSGEAWKNAGLGKAVKAGNMDEAKKLFTQYNGVMLKDENGEPYKKVLKGLDDRRKQEVQWFDDQRPYSPTANPPTPLSSKLPGQIGGGALGEDTARVAANQDQQVAQAPYTSTPVPGKPPGTPVQNNNPPGYTGAVPPASALESTEQLRARLLGASPDEHSKILEDYAKRSGTQFHEVPGGKLGVTPTPGGGQPQTTFIPGGDIPLSIGGMNIMMRNIQDPKTGKVEQRFILPGGPEKGFGSLDSALEWQRQNRVKDVTAEGTASKQVERYQTEQQAIQDQAEKSKLHLPQLNIVQRLIKDPANYVGVGSERVLDAKKILDAMGMGNPTMSQPASMEVLQKLIASSNLAAMEQLRGFGQVRTTDLRWLEQSNANMSNRPEAIMALSDIAKRMHQRSVELQELSFKYRKEHGGNLDSNWDEHLATWTKRNPLFDAKDIENYTEKLKEKVKQPKEEPTTPTAPAPTGPRRYVPGKGWE